MAGLLEIKRVLLPVDNMVSRVRNNRRLFNRSDFLMLRGSILSFVFKYLDRLYADLIDRYFNDRVASGGIFGILLMRYRRDFTYYINRAFDVAVYNFNRFGRLYGYVRGDMRVDIVVYLSMLLRTMLLNFERDFIVYVSRFYRNIKLFKVIGGIITTSASTCRFCNDRVFTYNALEFVRSSPQLRVHLFHPNCRHRIVPVVDGYSGVVYDVFNLPRIVNGHFYGYKK